jgi:hypothetical protein
MENPTNVNRNHFGAFQQEQITKQLEIFIGALCNVAPALGPHFLSGGTVDLKTMSGMQLRLGFSPAAGGIILPGGIAPRTPPPKGHFPQ